MASGIIRKIGMGTLSNSVMTVVSIASAILTVPLFIRAVGNDLYGLFVVVASVVGFVKLGDFGVTTAVTNKISYLLAEKKRDDISALFSGGLLFLIGVIGTVWLILGILFLTDVVSMQVLFGVEQSLASTARSLFFILLFFASLNTLFGSMLTSLFRGLNEIPRHDAVQTVYTILYTVSFVLFLLAKPSVFSIALFQGIAMTVRLFIFGIAAKIFFRWLRVTFRFAHIKRVTALLTHSVTFFFLSFCNSLINKTDLLVLSHVVGVGMAPVYSIADRIFRLPTSMVQVAPAAMPSIAALYKKKKMDQLATLYRQVLRMHVILKGTPLLFMFIYGKEIIDLWVGDFFVHSDSLLALFFISFMIFAWAGPHFIFINAMFKHRSEVLPMIFNVIINLGVSIFLASRIGVMGIVVGTIAGNICTTAIYLPIFLRRHLAIKPFTELFKIVVSFILPLGLLAGLHYINVFWITQLGYQIAFAVPVGLVYVLSVYYGVFTKSERTFLFTKIQNQLRSFFGKTIQPSNL